MSSKRKKNTQLIDNVLITDIGTNGQAIGKVEDLVIWVDHAIPGDIVTVQVTKKRKSYVEAKVVSIEKYSEDRIQPKCPHFNLCGGCTSQDMTYTQQLYFKEKSVTNCLTRIGHLSIPDVKPILPSEDQWYYRNKLEFTFSSNRWKTDEEIASNETLDNRAVGFHIPGRFDKILDVQTCFLQPEPSNQLRNTIRDFCIKESIPFYDLRSHEGLLRTMVIRTASTGETMLILSFKYECDEMFKLLEFVKHTFPQLDSLMYVLNPKLNDSFADLPVTLYSGKDHIMERMENLRYKVGPKSFYQTNSKQAYALYSIVRQMANLTGHEIVYDLYTGTGTIANFLAHQAKKVIGVEYIEDAIRDAETNSQLNNITNTLFFAGDMKDVFTMSFIQSHGQPDLVVLDPPRAGIHPNVISALLTCLPKKIIYVSCNPATQARDIALLAEQYSITDVQPVDMFPHTHHVENVVSLLRND